MKSFLYYLCIYFNLFNWRLITLQYCSEFCCTLAWISDGCTCVPHPAPFPLPSHPIPQSCPSAPALSALLHALNLDWWSIPHMVIYMFPCYSLKSSHSSLFPQSSIVCSLYVSFAVSCLYFSFILKDNFARYAICYSSLLFFFLSVL